MYNFSSGFASAAAAAAASSGTEVRVSQCRQKSVNAGDLTGRKSNKRGH